MLRQFFSNYKLKGLSMLAVLLCIGAYSVHFAQAHYIGLTGQSSLATNGCGGPRPSQCHGLTPSQTTTVTLTTNATQFVTGGTYIFQIEVKNHSNPLLIAAGCNISVDPGPILDTVTPSEGLTYFPTLTDATDTFYVNELAHLYPKLFDGGDSAVWQFKFIAPDTPGQFVIYAAGNAVNGDSAYDGAGPTPDDPTRDTDKWNVTTDTINVVVPNSVSSETALASDVRIYPNPSAGLFTLSSVNERGTAEIKISDEGGKIIETRTAALSLHTPLDLTSLPDGTYFLHIKTSDGQSFLRRVVIRK